MAEQLTKAEYLASLTPLPEQNSDRGDCPICYETLTEATQTPCGHIFCLECLKLWVNENELCNSQCPSCRVTLYHYTEEESDEENSDDEDLIAAMEAHAELTTRLLQLEAMDHPIIIPGSVLRELTIEYVDSIRDRDLETVGSGEEVDTLGWLIFNFPDLMDQFLEADARYAFCWRYSVTAFGFSHLTVHREDVGDGAALHDGDIHPMDDLAGRVRNFFNALGNGGMTSIIVQRAIDRELTVDAEYLCPFSGPWGIALEI
ncbi:uncharacterized protein RHO25_005873 [Cercospora beticola]|uniref:RING-type domain-containing protein n=1 Tax=Cercospora beticola TaxID=122368 RepID=A0ABZ0NP06_CERBT|nr:hypothetical protein RHO25_005873 [Cercospora beticola]CAK1363987.1 unnamed protein product [Cercospora beticola]